MAQLGWTLAEAPALHTSRADRLPFRPRIRRPRSLPAFAATADADGTQRWTVAITGGTGFVGARLAQRLLKDGHSVRILTRNVREAEARLAPLRLRGDLRFYPAAGWAQGVDGSTHVVNLAGEPISVRWSEGVKREILSSRLTATARLVSAIQQAPPERRPRALVSASAVGFYGAGRAPHPAQLLPCCLPRRAAGTSTSARFDEESAAGADYLAQVCTRWEAAAQQAAPLGCRVAILRLGIVIDRGGGALAKMAPLFQVFAGGAPGDGRQWFSWVHMDDCVSAAVRALADDGLSGPVNVTAPRPVRMQEMCRALGAAMGRPSWLPVPEFAIQALLGDGAKVVVEGQQVMPARLQAAGFEWRYLSIEEALRSVVAQPR